MNHRTKNILPEFSTETPAEHHRLFVGSISKLVNWMQYTSKYTRKQQIAQRDIHKRLVI